MLQQSRDTKLANQRTAGLVDVAAMGIAKTGCKRIERRGVFGVAGIKNGHARCSRDGPRSCETGVMSVSRKGRFVRAARRDAPQ